jgi:hypothetical protein
MSALLQSEKLELPASLRYTWRDSDFNGVKLTEVMQFRLTYEGSLKASGNSTRRVADKHHIRRAFHQQLAQYWQTHAVLRHKQTFTEPETDGIAQMRAGGSWLSDPDSTEVETLARRFNRCGYRFVPLVNSLYGLVCGLDILFLRREDAGKVVLKGGDIDNRIKTLLDACRIPEHCQEIAEPPVAGEDPFFCLMESDALITDLNITTDRWLAPPRPAQDDRDVFLIIQVTVKSSGSGKGFGNLLLLS